MCNYDEQSSTYIIVKNAQDSDNKTIARILCQVQAKCLNQTSVINLYKNWKEEIKCYLKDYSHKVSRYFKLKMTKYVLVTNILYMIYKTKVLLEYLGTKETLLVISEVHKRLYGSYQFIIKMRWLIMNHDFYWLGITKQYISYVKECQTCYSLVQSKMCHQKSSI